MSFLGGSSPYFQAITFTVPSRVPTGWMDIIILYSVHGNNIYTNPETPDSMYGVLYKHPYMTSQSQLLASGPSPAADLGFKAWATSMPCEIRHERDPAAQQPSVDPGQCFPLGSRDLPAACGGSSSFSGGPSWKFLGDITTSTLEPVRCCLYVAMYSSYATLS